MESIFAGIGTPRSYEMAEEGDQYENKIKALIADAVDYNDSNLSPEREDNLKYYYGDLPGLDLGEEELQDPDNNGVNRSEAVSTDVRDTVMAILPSLMRIFCSTEHIADFVPNGPGQEEMARQVTEDVLHTFWEDNEGFLLLYTLFKTAMIEKIAVVKWSTDDDKEVTQTEFRNITEEQAAMVIQEAGEGAEVVEHGPMTMITHPEGQLEVISRLVVQSIKSKPVRVIDEIAPSDFRIDRRATRVSNARLVGCATIVPGSDLVKKGYDQELVDNYTGSYEYYSVERSIKNPAIDTSVAERDLVEYGEYWILIDQDGDGIDELHYICTMGSNYDIVKDEIVEARQIAIFCGDPRPGSAIGDAVADMTKDIQKYKSQLLRGALDNISASIFPDMAVNENLVNVEDVQADGVGRIIRTKTDPRTAIHEYRTTFAGRDIFEMMGTLDMVRQSRTGISEASKGVDPKALQSTNLMGIDAIVSGSQERIELIARVFAETGFKDLMKGLLREIVRSPNRKRTIEINGSWKEYDQSIYDPNLRVRVNPTLGKGSDMSRIMTLQKIQETQLMIMNTMGINNPFVKPDQYYNTIEDMMAIVNMKSINRYFTKPTPEIMASLQGPQEPSAEDVLARATLEEVKSKTANNVAQAALAEEKMRRDDDFRRDKLGLDNLVKLVTSFAEHPFPTEAVAPSEALVESQNTP